MLSVVIPSYNRRESMLALLADLDRQRNVQLELIVVDDCSSDGTPTAIREYFPDVLLLVNKTNGGPAVCRNIGINAAKFDTIVGFDSDVSIPDPNCLEKILNCFEAVSYTHLTLPTIYSV